MKNNPISEKKLILDGPIYSIKNNYPHDMLSNFYDHIAKYFDIANMKDAKEHLIKTFINGKSGNNTSI